MSKTDSSVSPKPRRWPRRLAIGGAPLLVLFVGLYFIATSAAFFKGFILPRVSAALNAQVTVADASISPFSRVVLRDLKVQTTGTEPLISAKEARVRYSLWNIIGGKVNVAEIVVESPTVTAVKNADGTSNLDPITKSQTPSGTAKPEKSDKSSRPLELNLGKFALNNATVRLIQQHQGGGRDLTELSGVNVTLEDLKNGQTGKLKFSTDIALDNQPPTPGANASLTAKLEGGFELGLAADLTPSGTRGGFKMDVSRAAGAFAQLTGMSMVFDTDITTDLKQQSAQIRALTLTGSQNQRALLLASLSSPMTLAWGQSANAIGDAALNLTLTNLNLADWKAFAPGFDANGLANAIVKITSKQGGKEVGFDVAARIENLAAAVGSNRLDGITVSLSALGGTANFKRFDVTTYQVALARLGEPLATINGSVKTDTETKTTEAKVNLDAFLDRLLRILPQPAVNLLSGRVQLAATVGQSAAGQTVAGKLDITTLTGNYASQRFTNLAVGATCDMSLRNPQAVDIRHLRLVLVPTARSRTNALELSGRVDLSKTNAIEGALRLISDSLDVTPYYDLVAGNSGAPKESTPVDSQPKEPLPPSGGDTEPAAVQLPIKLLTFDVNIGRCYLREIEMSNIVASAQVEGSRITVKPVQLTMNGAPVSSEIELNLSQPGWQYALSFNANRLPIEPLANSFSPDYRGRAKGEVLANVQIKGSGLTGASLRQNLAGNLGLTFTNADIQIVGTRLKNFLTPIAAAIKAPGLLSSPLNWAGIDTTIGSGKINFGQLALVSPSFAAATRGEIPIADNLSASPLRNWPMSFQLPRGVAEKLNLLPKDAPTNAVLIAMPDFIKVAGTLNAPKAEIDYKALASAALMKYADKIPGVDAKTGELLKGFGGLLSGQGKTNSGATNQTSVSDLLNSLTKPKPKSKPASPEPPK